MFSHQGQTIDVLLVHEIKRLVDGMSVSETFGSNKEQEVLIRLLGWLQNNGVVSEEMQLKQFSIKEMHNCSREPAMKKLLQSCCPNRVRGREEHDPVLATRFHPLPSESASFNKEEFLAAASKNHNKKQTTASDARSQMTMLMSEQDFKKYVLQAIFKLPRDAVVYKYMYGYNMVPRVMDVCEFFINRVSSPSVASKKILDWWEYCKLPDGDKIFQIKDSQVGIKSNVNDGANTVDTVCKDFTELLNEAIMVFQDDLDNTLPASLIISTKVSGKEALDSEQEQEQEQVTILHFPNFTYTCV
jgi:hypothetical protein